MSSASERASERTSEWPSTYVSILVCSRPQCGSGKSGRANEGRFGIEDGDEVWCEGFLNLVTALYAADTEKNGRSHWTVRCAFISRIVCGGQKQIET